jgi:hypothetical protein
MFFVSLAVVAAAQAVAPIEAATVAIDLVVPPSSATAPAGKPNQRAQ